MCLARALALSAFLLALPTLKNVALYLRYEHDRQSLARVSGPGDGVAGTWKAAFDAFPCGMDMHYHLRLTLDADGRGRLTEMAYGRRIGLEHTPDVYSWSSLLPLDHHGWISGSASVRDSLGTLIIEPDGEAPWSRTEYAVYRVSGDELYLWKTTRPGVLPVKRWSVFPEYTPDLTDFVQPWW